MNALCSCGLASADARPQSFVTRALSASAVADHVVRGQFVLDVFACLWTVTSPHTRSVDVGSSFGADAESSEAFEPGEGAFDRPSDCAEAGAVFDAVAGDDGCDSAVADQAPVHVMVVAAVGVDPPWPAGWFADQSADRRDGVDERDQLGDVVAGPPVSVTAKGMPVASVIR